MNQKVLDWLKEPPFSDPILMSLRPNFSYEDWFDRGRALPGSVETLIELLEQEDLRQPSGNGMRAAYALGWIGDRRERAIKALLRVNGSKDTELRFEAVAALGRLRETSAATALEGLAVDPREDVNVRANACIALGQIGAPSSEPILQQVLNDKDPFVAKCADEGLKLFRAGSSTKKP